MLNLRAATVGMISTVGLIAAVSADEMVVFDQQWSSTQGAPISDSTSRSQIADNFVLLEDTWVTGISWFGGYPDEAGGPFGGIPPGSTMQFFVWFFDDDVGKPAQSPFWPIPLSETVIASFEDTGTLTGGLRVFEFEVTLPEPILIYAGETVWLALVEAGSPESPAATNFFWLGSEGLGDGVAFRSLAADPWMSGGTSDVNFKLFGTLLDADTDSDGVPDDTDVCPDTLLPESVPTSGWLLPNRFALIDQGPEFSAGHSLGKNPKGFTIFDTAGCSCEQIIELMDLGTGHARFGCSRGALRTFIDALPE